MVEKRSFPASGLSKTTLIVVSLALLFGSSVALLEIYRQKRGETPKLETTSQAFNLTLGDLQSLAIANPGKTLQIERSPAPADRWQLRLPDPKTVSEPALIFVMNLLAGVDRSQDFTAPASQLADYGLVPPRATLTLKPKNGQTQQLWLGNPNFQGKSLYAVINPTNPLPKTVKISLVSLSFADVVKRSPQDWLKVEDTPPPQPASPIPATSPQP
ncbi:MAG: DUF4340 domain-containing protein [Merismopediaceae bacterium]|nr:DUF4340 domain-containing protein [Merismopediaceae bacterium]